MISGPALKLAEEVVAGAAARGLRLSTAESCTGGLVSAALTSVSGSSAVFTHGFVTYANEAKTQMLGVSPKILATHGAVSPQVASLMAQGARKNASADITVSLTGIAGPGGGTPRKPVGLVWFGLCTKVGTRPEHRVFAQLNRSAVREKATLYALTLLLQAITQHPD